MLRFFAKLERSRNLLLLGFCGLLLIGLIAFYIPNTSLMPGAATANSAEDNTVIAKVGGREITLKEYRGALAGLASSIGRGQSIQLPMLKAMGMDKQALDGLIGNALVLDQGDNLDLTGTDREVGDVVKRTFVDNDGRFIGKDEYMRRLRLQGSDVGEFERRTRDDLTLRKIRSYLTSAEQISDREIEEKFKKDQTSVELVYGLIDLDKVRKVYQPSASDLQAYYDAHKDEFKVSELTRKVDYIFIPTDEVQKIINVPDAELQAQYESNKQKEFRASIIRLDVLANPDEQTVRAKIDELASRAKPNQSGQSEDFATLAKGNSQDPSKAQGGDIGWIKKEPNKTSNWRQRPYSIGLKVGDVDGPFRDGKSWYLMKITEERDVPFADMRPTLLATARNNKAFVEASKLADEAYEKATEAKDLRKGAEAIAAKLKMAPAALIKSTPYFKNGDPMPGLGKGSGWASNPAFEEATATLKEGEIGDKVQIPGGYAVPQATDVLDNGTQMTFDQARNQVEDKVRKEKEPDLAKTRAQELANQAQSAADLERLMKAEGLDVKSDTNFSSYQWPGMAAGGLQSQNQARTAMLTLKEGEVYKTPIKVGAAYLIFGATKRNDADLTRLPAERDGLRQTLINDRQTAAYDAFVKAARKRYEDEGKIKVYQDRIDRFFAAAAPQ